MRRMHCSRYRRIRSDRDCADSFENYEYSKAREYDGKVVGKIVKLEKIMRDKFIFMRYSEIF